MALETADHMNQSSENETRSLSNLVAEFQAWLTPQEKIWDDQDDQLAELFTEFLRGPQRRVPEAIITQLQGEFYTWLKRHSMEVHFLVKKLRQPGSERSPLPGEETLSWEQRWNEARSREHGQPQPKTTPDANYNNHRYTTTAEKPLRD